ncbi:MAG: c-type cytochrome [Saprospiraceae bacterium]|nr:c-type cytochrome [Saprospiraceae bacterium]
MRLYLFAISLLLFTSCGKDDKDEASLFPKLPDYFPSPVYPLNENPITQDGFVLGKDLFNDPLLSSDNSVACSNCHVKAVAFTDPQHALSLGVDERSGIRNAPPIVNMAFMKVFMWDGGVVHLDFVPPNAIENPLEMNEKMAHVVAKLNRHSSYPGRFKKVFPTMDTITSPLLLKALAQFQLMLVSQASKYDKVRQGKSEFTTTEARGYDIYKQKCASCHTEPLFTNQQFFNNGLDTQFADEGRARITESALDLGKFKVPSLRNVVITAPYMHDGRFKDLNAVLEHYNNGVKYSATLAAQLQSGVKPGIALSVSEKADLIAFLSTLTDYELISDPRF